MNFTVLIPLYKNNVASQVEEALTSVLGQSRPAEQVMVLLDGPVPADLSATLDRFAAKGVRVESFPVNRGLPTILNEGLRLAETDWVFRMDGDDVATPTRFEKQAAFLSDHPEVKLLGGQVSEFADIPSNSVLTRKVPQTYDEILRFSRSRNPFNHPTVAYDRRAALSIGGYDERLVDFEDYDLWTRMLQAGMRAHNLPDILVHMRTGDDFVLRRSGLRYLKREWAFLRKLRRRKYIGLPLFCLFIVIRLPLRLLPQSLLRLLYRRFLRPPC